MKKSLVLDIVSKYLSVFPQEAERLARLKMYLAENEEKEMCDWNNARGHLTAGGFVYSQSTQKFLVMWHKDLGMYLYPGGHCESSDNSPLQRAKLEAKEETGLELANLRLFDDESIPLDIDTHKIPYNARVNMPEHWHFDFRYVFVAKGESGVAIDEKEMSNYKWIDKTTLASDPNYGNIVGKLERVL